MKWIIIAVLMINDQPTRVQLGEVNGYDTIGDCNYQMMRQVFQLHTASWSIQCVQVPKP